MKEISEIHFPVCKTCDLSRFIYTNKFVIDEVCGEFENRYMEDEDDEYKGRIKLPKKHIDYLQISTNVIIENINELIIDNFVVTIAWFGRNDNCIDLSMINDIKSMIIHNQSKISTPMKLPLHIQHLEIDEKVNIENLDIITIDLFEFIHDDENRKEILKYWNKESEELLKEFTEINFTSQSQFDLSRYIYTKKFNLKGYGNIKLPNNHIESLEFDTGIIIHNLNEIPIDELIINATYYSDLDCSPLNIKKKIELNSCQYSITATLPLTNSHVKISNGVKITNLKEITIDTFEIIDKEKDKRIVFKNWNKESEEELKEITEMELLCNLDYDLSRFIYLKRITANNFGKVKLPKKHFEYLHITSITNIENNDEITIDKLSMTIVSNDPVDLSHFTNVKQMIEIDDSGNLYCVSISQLPQTNCHIKLIGNCEIKNLSEITIDLLEITDREGNTKQIFKNWNKETEEDLKETTEISIFEPNNLDFSRFIYTNKFIFEGYGTVKLPKKHIEYLYVNRNIVIQNSNEITIGELIMICQSSCYLFDLSQFTVTKLLQISNFFPDEQAILEVKLPLINYHVKLIGNIEIINRNEITIEEIEQIDREEKQSDK